MNKEMTMQNLLNRHEDVCDITELLLDCVSRIAFCQTEDPQIDALKTLRGCGIIAAEAQECQS